MASKVKPAAVTNELKKISEASQAMYRASYEVKNIADDKDVKEAFLKTFKNWQKVSTALAFVGIGFEIYNMFAQGEDPILAAIKDVQDGIEEIKDLLHKVGDRIENKITESEGDQRIREAKDVITYGQQTYEIIQQLKSKGVDTYKENEDYKNFTEGELNNNIKQARITLFNEIQEKEWLEARYSLSYGNIDYMHQSGCMIIHLYMKATLMISMARVLRTGDQMDNTESGKNELEVYSKREEDQLKVELNKMRETIGDYLLKCETEIHLNISDFVDHTDLKKETNDINDTRESDVKWYVQQLRKQYPFADFFCGIHRKGINVSGETMEKQWRKLSNAWIDYGTKFGGKECDIIVGWWAGKQRKPDPTQEYLTEMVQDTNWSMYSLGDQLSTLYDQITAKYPTALEKSLLFVVENCDQMNQIPPDVSNPRYLNYYGTENVKIKIKQVQTGSQPGYCFQNACTDPQYIHTVQVYYG